MAWCGLLQQVMRSICSDEAMSTTATIIQGHADTTVARAELGVKWQKKDQDDGTSRQGPTKVQPRSDQSPTKVRPRPDQGPTKIRPRSD
jgi:hypothetical protein